MVIVDQLADRLRQGIWGRQGIQGRWGFSKKLPCCSLSNWSEDRLDVSTVIPSDSPVVGKSHSLAERWQLFSASVWAPQWCPGPVPQSCISEGVVLTGDYLHIWLIAQGGKLPLKTGANSQCIREAEYTVFRLWPLDSSHFTYCFLSCLVLEE